MQIKHSIKYILCIIIMLQSIYASSQQIIGRDYGFFVGTSQYNGDVNMTKAYYSPHLTGALWYKQIYNSHYSLRFAITYGEIKASDLDFDNAYQQNRKYEFSDHNIYEFSTLIEFNFFPITPDEDENNISPYVVAGPGLFFAQGVEGFNILCFPMGVGIKYRLSSRMELNVEWVFRKTFSDNLDELESSQESGYKQYKQQSFDETNDWYSLLGASILISFMNPKSPCPVYRDKLNYELIKKHR